MTKRERERLKREKLDSIMQNHPALDKFLESLVADDKPDIQDAVKIAMQDALNKARMDGTKSGYIASLVWVMSRAKAVGCEKAIEEATTKAKEMWKNWMGDTPMMYNNEEESNE